MLIFSLKRIGIRKNNHNFSESTPRRNVHLLKQVLKILTMGENVLIISNVFQDSVMTLLTLVKGESRENHATIMSNVIEILLVDQVLSGLMKLSVFPWVMSTHDVRQTLIVNQETFVGGRKIWDTILVKLIVKHSHQRFVQKSMCHQIALCFGGTWINFQKKTG